MSKKKHEHEVIVTGVAHFDAEQSNVEQQKFIWSYEITITNNTDNIIQLLNRQWLITDMAGKVEQIQGVGVIGLQPIIKPNKQFNYTSYCQLVTPQGTMEGQYEMQDLDENHFIVQIPKFILSAPTSITKSYRSLLH